jgi:hypothetical protein
MSNCLKYILLSALVIMASAAVAQPTMVNFDFGAVRIACPSDYAYEGPISWGCQSNPTLNINAPSQNYNANPNFGWTLGSVVAIFGDIPIQKGAGLTGPGTVFNPPPFNGMPFNQAVFLQSVGSFVWQRVQGFTAGNYTLSFYLGSRYRNDCCDGDQTVQALIDGKVVGIWAMKSYTPFTLETANFTVSTDGSHNLMFEGMNVGDHTAFLSYVTITPAGQ